MGFSYSGRVNTLVEIDQGSLEAKAQKTPSEHLVNQGPSRGPCTASWALALPSPRRQQALGTLRHGQLLGRPRVRQVDDETVSVGFKAARSRTVAVLAKNLRIAKAKEWPRALRG